MGCRPGLPVSTTGTQGFEFGDAASNNGSVSTTAISRAESRRTARERAVRAVRADVVC